MGVELLFMTTANAAADAVAKLLHLAKQGDAAAQADIGKIYYEGADSAGVSQNYDEALRWVRLAVIQGHAGAQTCFATMYLEGAAIAQNYDEAVRWFVAAAKQGSAAAQFNLGCIYEKGLDFSTRRDYKEAVKWYSQAAQQGHAGAQLNLAGMYEKGMGVLPDVRAAVNLFYEAAHRGEAAAYQALLRIADDGDAQVQFHLGQIYEQGMQNGGAQQQADYYTAIKWYYRAAKQWHDDARAALEALAAPRNPPLSTDDSDALAQVLFALGDQYYGDSSVHAKDEARLYRLAVEHGSEDALGVLSGLAEDGRGGACVAMGELCESGRGVPQNFLRALTWYYAATDWQMNQDEVVGKVARLLERVEQTSDEALLYQVAEAYHYEYRDYAAAVAWYRKAADKGHTKAQYQLGLLYERGEQVPQNYDEAVRWYYSAAEQGDANAQYKVGCLHESGSEVKQDYKEAYVWFSLAMVNVPSIVSSEVPAQRRAQVAAQLSPDEIVRAQKEAQRRLEAARALAG